MATFDAVFRASADFSKAIAEGKRLGDSFRRTKEETEKTVPDGAPAGKSYGNTFMSALKGVLASAALMKIFDTVSNAVRQSFDVGNEMIGYSKSLEILTGSAKTAGKVIKELYSYAQGSPLDTKSTVAAAKTLIGFGVAADDAVRATKILGNASVVTGGDLGGMALVMGQVSAAGKLSSQDMYQLINQGIPILQLMGKTTGKTTAELRDMMAQGKVSAEMVFEALNTAYGDPGLLERYADTGTAAMASMQDSQDSFLLSLGGVQAGVAGFEAKAGGLYDSIKKIMFGISKFLSDPAVQKAAADFGNGLATGMNWLMENGDVVVSVIAGLAAGILYLLAPAIWAAVTATWAWTVALLANPVTWIVIGIMALVAAIVWLAQNWDTATAWITSVWGQFVSWLGGVWDAIVAAVMGFGDQVASFLTGLWDGIVQTAQNVWNGIVDFFAGVMENLFLIIIGPLGVLALWIAANWDRIQAKAVEVWNAVVAFIAAIPQRIMDGLAFLASLPGKVAEWFMGVYRRAVEIFNQVVSFIASIPNRIVSALVALAGLAALAAEWFLGFLRAAQKKFNDLVDWVRNIPDRIRSALGALGSLLVNAGKALIDGFLRGIKAAWDTLVSWVKGAMEKLRGLWPFSPAKWGPFSGRGYVTYSGEAMTVDYAEAIRGGMGRVLGAAEDLLSGVSGVMAGGFDPTPALAADAGAGWARTVNNQSSQHVTQLYLDGLQVGMDSELEGAVRELVGVIGDRRRFDRAEGGLDA